MNINRNNYETFFLLYVDNELSAKEREAVKLFVAQNPDLQQEFNAIKQSVLPVDTIHFENKGQLRKEEKNVSLEERLLLLLDNEISPEEKDTLQQQIKHSASIAHEWEVLQQTRLFPDHSIVFANKRILFRKEKGRLVSAFWQRIAAAAMLTGFGFWMGIAYFNNYTIKEAGASFSKNSFALPIPNIHNTQSTASINTANTGSAITPVSNNNYKPGKTIQNQQNISTKQNHFVSNKNKKETPPHYNNINNRESNKAIVQSVLPEKVDTKLATNDAPLVDREYVLPEKQESAYAMNAVSTAPETATDNKILYISEEKVAKTKVGNFFRKAKEFLNKTTSNEEEKSLSIAGFEIAIR